MNNSLKTLHSSPAYLYHEPAKPKLLYPSLVIAAIAVTLFSLLGIATMTGILPQAHSAAGEDGGAARQEAVAMEKTATPQGAESAGGDLRASASNNMTAACHVCGSVESINQIESKGQGSGIGAVAGGIAGALLGNTMGAGNGRTAMTLLGAGGGAYAGNEIEKNTRKSTSYRIRVRLENGELRTVYQRTPPAVAVGDRVKVVNGEIVRLS